MDKLAPAWISKPLKFLRDLGNRGEVVIPFIDSVDEAQRPAVTSFVTNTGATTEDLSKFDSFDSFLSGYKPKAQANDWSANLPEDQRAVVSVKGWKAPGDVIKGYSELEKLVGHEKIAMPRKDAQGNYEPGEFERVMSQLGMPKDSKDYKPSDTFKLPPGMALDEKFMGEFKAKAQKAGMLPKQFAFVMDELAMIMNQGTAAKQTADKKAVDDAALALRGKWGLAYDAKSKTANNVLRNFAADQKSGEALAQKYGNDPLIIELLANVGENLNEESLSKVGMSGVLLSPEAAKLEIAKLREERSKELLDAGHPLHKFYVDKMDGLYRMAGA